MPKKREGSAATPAKRPDPRPYFSPTFPDELFTTRGLRGPTDLAKLPEVRRFYGIDSGWLKVQILDLKADARYTGLVSSSGLILYVQENGLETLKTDVKTAPVAKPAVAKPAVAKPAVAKAAVAKAAVAKAAVAKAKAEPAFDEDDGSSFDEDAAEVEDEVAVETDDGSDEGSADADDGSDDDDGEDTAADADADAGDDWDDDAA